MYRKRDSDDAQAIALATITMLDKLPDACPNDAYWSFGQLVNIVYGMLKNGTEYRMPEMKESNADIDKSN